MQLYTLIFEYAGGTYIRQCRAATPHDSLTQSARSIGETLGAAQSVIEQVFEDEHPVSIEGCANVWCATSLLNDQLVIVHIVETTPSRAE